MVAADAHGAPAFFCPPEHGQAAAAVRDVDRGMWSLFADAAAAHHHLRVRVEVRTSPTCWRFQPSTAWTKSFSGSPMNLC